MDGEATEVWNAMRALPKRQARAVALHYLDDLLDPWDDARSEAVVSNGLLTRKTPLRIVLQGASVFQMSV